MTTLTIRIPDDTAARLRELARHRGISLDKLMEEFWATGLAEFDTAPAFACEQPVEPRSVGSRSSTNSTPDWARSRLVAKAGPPGGSLRGAGHMGCVLLKGNRLSANPQPPESPASGNRSLPAKPRVKGFDDAP
jgi:hypothetical protein